MDYIAEHYITIIFTLFYIVGCLCIGWYFKSKANKGVEGYYVAKREIPGWVISLAFFSTSASTNTYIGQAGISFKYGLSWAWMGLIWTLFCIVSWQLLGPRMRYQTALLKSYTIPDYFHLRYKSNLAKTIRVFSAFIILFATIWYMIGIAKGCAHVLTSVLDIPYWLGAFLILSITCIYTIWGGMYSVLWTDAIQGILMFGVAILMLAIPFIYLGGIEDTFTKISNTNHLSAEGKPIENGLVVFGELVSFLYILGIGLSIGMKQISEPKNLIRFYSINNAKSMRFAMIWTPFFLGISLVCVMGLGALVHGMANYEEALYLIKNTDEVVGFMLNKFDNAWVSAVCVAGLFAAGMSSLASVIIIIGTAFVKDIWHVIKPMKPSKIIPRTKWFMALYCIMIYAFTLFPIAGIVELTAFAGAVFAASFFPAIFGGLYLRWGTDIGALASMLTGILVNIIWRFGFRFSQARFNDIHEIIPAFIASLFVYLLVSVITKKRRPSKKHLSYLFK